MQVSGRVTNSFFCFLEKKHLDTSRFHELTSIDISLIKEPSIWLDIDRVEDFLKKISDEYGRHFIDKDLISSTGSDALELRAWGDLDHVLRMSQLSNFYVKVDEIFQWFVTPITIKEFRQQKDGFTFHCSLSSKKYPYVVEYLRVVLEVLPVFKSEEMTEVQWNEHEVQIKSIPFGQMSFPLPDSYKKYVPSITIEQVLGREVLDSRGNPALEVEVHSHSGQARAMVPSGASTGRYEAHELRDEDKSRFHGKGVLKACENLNTLSQELKGMSVSSIEQVDQKLMELDGTQNKNNLGANTILGISMACTRLLAQVQKKPLYTFFNEDACTLPIPLVNVLNGGAHANNNLDVQEFMLVPHGFSSFKEALRAVSEVFQTLKKTLNKKGMSTTLGDEGGVAPSLQNNEEALKCLIDAIEKTGYRVHEHISLALDVAASSFYQDQMYLWEGKKITADELIDVYDSWMKNYPIVSIEDGLEEDKWSDWAQWTKKHGDKIQIVGDDLFVTNCDRLEMGFQNKAANSLLVKVNQIGTMTEAHQAVQMAHRHQYSCVMSHRSGETEDSFIADLSLSFGCEQIKTGGVSRGERTSKYNQLLRIEESLGSKARYSDFFKKKFFS